MIDAYVNRIATRYQTGIAREHSYRGDLQTLLESLNPGILVTNEPARIACGAPDFILTRQNIPIGYIEAKDIGVSLAKIDVSEQLIRYKASLDNLILTDYCEFWFYRNGKKVESLAIAEIRNGTLVSIPDAYQRFTQLIQDFCLHIGQTITSAQKLAEMMASKAKMMQVVIESALKSDEKNDQNSTLHAQMKAFQKILIHDITPAEFADIYAQTLAYGMFAARLHDPTLATFTRQEAASLIPKTNPFLRKLFSYIAGIDIDTRIVWIVDALADIFRAADVASILQNFGKATQTQDPMIHFYETFLAAYNPKLRKSRGVWYTPEPVVRFIVQAIDDILKTEFGLTQGLADTSKTTIEIETQEEDLRTTTKRKRAKVDVHKVQILDPAAGTGTFLAEVIKHIHQQFAGQQGIWSQYVEKHLIPRLHGFEILMASYAMAHLKLELLLQETGYRPETEQRLRVFLTNSLEEAHPDTGTFWAHWLSQEASEANYIKRDTPVMVVLGNPPYSGESINKSDWIMSLMDDYKQEPGGGKLQEKTAKWLNDDYVKFIRYGQYFVEKNGEGILAFINNHGFLDNPTFRGMRWHLLRTFDKIYIIDLHGNSKKREVSPDGSPDKNVFDIQQGVSINLFVKTGTKKQNQLAQVFHYDLYGGRDIKYDFLQKNSIKGIEFSLLSNKPPLYFFTQKDFKLEDDFKDGFLLNDVFLINNSGVVTKRDKLNIHFTQKDVETMLYDFQTLEENDVRIKYSIPKDVRDWNFTFAKNDLKESGAKRELIEPINYRPFDKRFFFYSGKSRGIVGWPVPVVSEHLKNLENLGLMTNKKIEIGDFKHIIVYRGIVESHAISMKEINYVFPLYLYQGGSQQQMFHNKEYRIPNLNNGIVQKITEIVNLKFTPEKEERDGTFAPIDILDYIYAVLHSPIYRETYKEFLKIDFPSRPLSKRSKDILAASRIRGRIATTPFIRTSEGFAVHHHVSSARR